MLAGNIWREIFRNLEKSLFSSIENDLKVRVIRLILFLNKCIANKLLTQPILFKVQNVEVFSWNVKYKYTFLYKTWEFQICNDSN